MRDLLADVAALNAAPPHARPANRRLGHQIATTGAVDFTVQDDAIVATVAGSPGTTTRKVTLKDTDGIIEWTCTCMRGASPWCKHAIAVVIAAVDTACEGHGDCQPAVLPGDRVGITGVTRGLSTGRFVTSPTAVALPATPSPLPRRPLGRSTAGTSGTRSGRGPRT